MHLQLQFLNIHIRRSNIVEDTINQLMHHEVTDYKRPLKVYTDEVVSVILYIIFSTKTKFILFFLIFSSSSIGPLYRGGGRGCRWCEEGVFFAPSSGDPQPRLWHVYRVLRDACHLVQRGSIGGSRYLWADWCVSVLWGFLCYSREGEEVCLYNDPFFWLSRDCLWSGHLQLHHHQPSVPHCTVQEAARGVSGARRP